MLHFDGKAWTALDTATDATLWWVHVVAARSVWAVGDSGISGGSRRSAMPSRAGPAGDGSAWPISAVANCSRVVVAAMVTHM